MLNLRTSKAKESEKEKQGKEDKPTDDEISEVSENVVTIDGEDPESKRVDDTDDGKTDMDDDENVDINETTNGEAKARRSSRKRKQRLTIKNDEKGDCDDENDPDYKS